MTQSRPRPDPTLAGRRAPAWHGTRIRFSGGSGDETKSDLQEILAHAHKGISGQGTCV